MPCCYVKLDGEVLLCESKNKNRYSHIGSAGHKRFLDEIRPLETARRNPGVLQQFIRGVAAVGVAAVDRLFGGGESEGGESDCSTSSSGDSDEGGMDATMAAIEEAHLEYNQAFQEIFDGEERIDYDALQLDDDFDDDDE